MKNILKILLIAFLVINSISATAYHYDINYDSCDTHCPPKMAAFVDEKITIVYYPCDQTLTFSEDVNRIQFDTSNLRLFSVNGNISASFAHNGNKTAIRLVVEDEIYNFALYKTEKLKGMKLTYFEPGKGEKVLLDVSAKDQSHDEERLQELISNIPERQYPFLVIDEIEDNNQLSCLLSTENETIHLNLPKSLLADAKEGKIYQGKCVEGDYFNFIKKVKSPKLIETSEFENYYIINDIMVDQSADYYYSHGIDLGTWDMIEISDNLTIGKAEFC